MLLLARILAAEEARARRAFIFPIPLFLPASPERQVSFLPREARQSVSFFQKRFAQSV
jgi:hypothetical protein